MKLYTCCNYIHAMWNWRRGGIHSFCDIYKKKNGQNAEVVEHECVKNHFGSSKSMECEAILHLTIDSWTI